MFSIYFTNHGYTKAETFATLDDAIVGARKAGFQSAIFTERDGTVATYCPLNGVSHVRPSTWRNMPSECVGG